MFYARNLTLCYYTNVTRTFSYLFGLHDNPQLVYESSRLTNKSSDNYEEAKMRAQQIQCVARQMKIPGLSNNTTGNLN